MSGRRAWRHGLLVLALAGCAGVPPVTDRVAPGDPTAVREQVVAELRALGLVTFEPGNGVISAKTSQAPGDWASCSPALVGRGGSNESRRMVSVRSREAAVEVALQPLGDATKVEVTARFSARYDNPETATSFERACRSNGVLEARLLAAAGS